MNREERIAVMQENLRLVRSDAAAAEHVRKSIANQVIYWEEDPLPPVPPRFDAPARVSVTRERSIEAAARYAGKNVCVLNFASFVTPGGGVLKGASAQEESLCRVTSLYPALAAPSAGAFYASHKEAIARGTISRKNSDDCIYTPHVLCLREDTFDCALLPESERFEVSVITCAAPDQRSGMGGRSYRPTDAMQLADFERRIGRILTVAAMHGTDVLILGAFGCGVFGNSPRIVAKAFERQLPAFARCFETVVFAVWCKDTDDENYRAFLPLGDAGE